MTHVATIDLARARADTPGCAHVAHFNNAGAGLMPARCSTPWSPTSSARPTIGGYEAAAEAGRSPRGGLRRAGRAAGLRPRRDRRRRERDARVGHGLLRPALRARRPDPDCARAEYASNVIALLQVAERTGAVVELVPNDEHGQLSVAALGEMLDERVKLVAITHVPTNGGLVNPAEEIGALTRAAGVPYLLDACQSVGQMPLDVEAHRLRHAVGDRAQVPARAARDRLALRAPRAGRPARAAVARPACRRVGRPPTTTRSARARGASRTGRRNFAGKIGLGGAVRLRAAPGGWRRSGAGRRARRAPARGAGAVPGVRVRDRASERCGIVTFTVAAASRAPRRRAGGARASTSR